MPSSSLASRVQIGAEALLRQFPALENAAFMLQVGTGFDTTGLLDETIAAAAMHEVLALPQTASPAGHPLRFELGRCGQQTILLAHGRRHLYEGFGIDACVLPVCAALRCGVRNVIGISAVGGVRCELKPGTVLCTTDFINNLGTSPLVGNQALTTTPFPDMSQAFSQALIAEFVNAAGRVGMTPRLGVYQANLGPQFESPAETAIARENGADVVGMSLVPETIMAHAMGARMMGLAMVSNAAAEFGQKVPSHNDVLESIAFASHAMVRALRQFFLDCDSEALP